MDEGENAPAARNAYEAKRGAIAILPLALGASVYGLAFGFLAVQVGFPWWGVAIMSASTHAGSSQIIAVERPGDHRRARAACCSRLDRAV